MVLAGEISTGKEIGSHLQHVVWLCLALVDRISVSTCVGSEGIVELAVDEMVQGSTEMFRYFSIAPVFGFVK